MGLFSSKKVTYVSSSVWNMAGDFTERTNYLRFLLSSSVLSNAPSLSTAVIDGTRYGPHFSSSMVYRWMKRNYGQGIPAGGFLPSKSVDPGIVASQITPPGTGWMVQVNQARAGQSDFTKWAEERVYTYFPERIGSNWTAQYNANGTITVLFPDMFTTTFMPVNFVDKAQYLYIEYCLTRAGSTVMTPEGNPVIYGPLPNSTLWPSDVGFDVFKTDTFTQDYSLDTTVEVDVTYSDSTPSEHTETTTTVEESRSIARTYRRKFESAFSSGSLRYARYTTHAKWVVPSVSTEVVTEEVEEEISAGVTKTTITKTTIETISDTVNTYWYNTQKYRQEIDYVSPVSYWFYRIGSGNAVLDNLVNSTEGVDGFYPVFPLRIDNRFLSEPPLSDHFPAVEAAYKKASSGKKLNDLLIKVNENPDIGDIDFAFMVYGVPVNTRSRDSKRYIMEFLDTMVAMQSGSISDFENAVANNAAWVEWYNERARGNYQGWMDGDGNAVPMEPAPNGGIVYPSLNSIRLRCANHPYSSFDQRIEWAYMQRTVHGGRYLGLGTGDFSLQQDGTFPLVPSMISISETSNGFMREEFYGGVNVPLYYLRYQLSDEAYIQYKIYGMEHINEVYNGVSITTTLAAAFGDPEESGFFFPIHYSTLQKLPLTKANQVMTESQLMVINSYTVVKKRWYQRGFFKIVVLIVSIAVAVVFPPAGGLGAASGFLGTNAAVGAMVGLTGMAGAIAGAVVNGLVAILVINVIQGAATKVFGDQLGDIIGAIASVVSGGMVSGQIKVPSASAIWGELSKADNIMKMTDAVSKGYMEMVNQKIEDLQAKSEDYVKQAEEQGGDITQKLLDMIGYGNSNANPMLLMDNNYAIAQESSEDFLARTLMTGDEIAAISQRMIYDFAELNLKLKDATS